MTLPEQIRNSVASGDFARAARQFDEHARQILAAIENRTCDAATMRQTGELVQWVRKMGRAHHSHLQYRLQQLRSRAHVNGAYR